MTHALVEENARLRAEAEKLQRERDEADERADLWFGAWNAHYVLARKMAKRLGITRAMLRRMRDEGDAARVVARRGWALCKKTQRDLAEAWRELDLEKEAHTYELARANRATRERDEAIARAEQAEAVARAVDVLDRDPRALVKLATETQRLRIELEFLRSERP